MATKDYEKFMKRCIELAAFAKANGKTAVGSIVVKRNEIIAEGIEGDGNYPELIAHAEIIALIKATEKMNTRNLEECSLFTTVEPCFMCTYAIRKSGIRILVYGTDAGEIGGVNSIFPLLTTDKIKQWAPAPQIIGGILKEECEQILRK